MSESEDRKRERDLSGEKSSEIEQVEPSRDEHQNKKSKLETVAQNTNGISDGISESDVGITWFLTPQLPGFSGQIKQRYTDFLVNEIDKQGSVVHLTDKGFKMPKAPKKSKSEEAEEEKAELEKRKAFTVDPELRAKLVEVLGESDVAKIEDVYKNVTKMETSKKFEDKGERTQLHQLLRAAFNNQLESVTSPENTFHIALATRKSRVSRKDLIDRTKDANGVENWGYGPSKEFVHFTAYKENKDTMDVANILARYLRVPTRVIRYAGTKDRRAITCQRMSVSKIGVERLNALNRVLKGVVLGGFKFENESLSLGDLQGNEFTIAIRDVKVAENSTLTFEKILEEGCSSIQKNGFINYFGMQRFGTFSVSTHEIGKWILLGDWKKVSDLILAEQENVLPISKEARKVWSETQDAEAALNKMPRQCVAESALLNCFVEQQTSGSSTLDYFQAINKIPRNLRTMYGHAYQSYVWNAVASKRIELFGLEIVAGDLILDDGLNQASEPCNGGEDAATVKEDDEDFAEDLREAHFERARPVTQEEVDSGKYSINDVVLPSPGFDVVYPGNETLRQLYVEVMSKDGLDPFDMRRKARDFSLAGSYRNVIHKPANIEYKILHYSSPTQQLVNTDLEILNNRKGKENGQRFMKDKLNRFPDDKGGESTAVILTFKLGVSAYATMLLRELMKVESSRRGDMCGVRS
ncbi:LAME_0F12508g1_1 [Lachancea meyersii CBS 8951]|uniref:LAME_0F12508g1_1 n=1 Tax=Lachancea meyersii CBS 8951 TaxID=1266667 RepID=A0A1G4JWU7_9SACH|nr:LAME_0F12508g1_1 [Lachancea meyersii CBS 8951]